MISVMNEFEIDRNPTSTPDLSFFGLDSPKDEQSTVDLTMESSDVDPSETITDMHGFAIGDMVWGKVKSHPWWPGHIFNESFASSSTQRTKIDGFVLVAFFGDSSYGWFDPAELIPYEPTFVEKSRQTTHRNFLKALDESIDEAKRRAALGISCRCRNPHNFRPLGVPRYFAVDVVGFERNGKYSKEQIERERDSFEPKNVLSFLQQVAVAPRETTKDVDWYRNMAVGLALRRALFEEFDETYAQAFGQQPVRPKKDEMGVPEQAESFAPRVAPLSGPLVIAETLSSSNIKKRKAITKLLSAPKLNNNNNKVIKSLKKQQKKQKNKYVLQRREEPQISSWFSSAATGTADSSPSPLPDSYHVLQKRETPVENIKPNEEDEGEEKSPPRTPPLPTASQHNAVGEKKKKMKMKKRALDDVVIVGDGQETKPKKMKKLKKDNADGSGSSQNRITLPKIDMDLSQLDLNNVLSDLHSLALDPYYGVERKAPLISRHIFLRFRSMVYSKAQDLPVAADDAQGEAAPREQIKPGKFIKRLNDPTRVRKNRAPSDRQEEIAAKRLKKITNLKSLANEKKTINTTTTVMTELVKKPESAKKPENNNQEQSQPAPPPLPKKESPTYLIMKFPPRATLPSVANLKARFARFGPLMVDSTRVFWKSHTCKVLFKFKSDALKAYSFVTSNNDIFGQIQVDYSIRELEAPAPEPVPEPPRLNLQQRPQPQQQRSLKSILKKPGDEAAKENQRVKFMLSGNANSVKVDSPPKSPPPLKSKVGFEPCREMMIIEGKDRGNGDISHRLLSLMIRCNDIVAALSSLPGFVPYRSL